MFLTLMSWCNWNCLWSLGTLFAWGSNRPFSRFKWAQSWLSSKPKWNLNIPVKHRPPQLGDLSEVLAFYLLLFMIKQPQSNYILLMAYTYTLLQIIYFLPSEGVGFFLPWIKHTLNLCLRGIILQSKEWVSPAFRTSPWFFFSDVILSSPSCSASRRAFVLGPHAV